MKQIRKPHKLGFFAMLLALLGFGGCQEAVDDNLRNMKLMYGSPIAEYEVKGKVTDEKGKPIEGIKVTVGTGHTADGVAYFRLINDGVYTDSDGNWENSCIGFPTKTLQVKFRDVDGSANGGDFAEDSTLVNVTLVKDSKKTDNPFYQGEAKATVPTFKLKKK